MLSAPEDENTAAPEMRSGRSDQPESWSASLFFFCELWGMCLSSEVLRLGETPKIREEAGGISRQLLQETEL